MMRRILQIIPTLDRSGAEKQLVLLAAGLPRDEFDVHVCALSPGGALTAELQRKGIERGRRSASVEVRSGRLAATAAAHRPAASPIWCKPGCSPPTPMGAPPRDQPARADLVASERCVDRVERLARNWPSTAIWPDALTPSSSTAAASRSSIWNRDCPAAKLRLIYNGIGPAAPSDDLAASNLLAELGLPADTRLIGAVGRLWPQKRVKDLIWAADLLKVIARRRASAGDRRRPAARGPGALSRGCATSTTRSISWAAATTCPG